jgi:hypothetical protein
MSKGRRKHGNGFEAVQPLLELFDQAVVESVMAEDSPNRHAGTTGVESKTVDKG